MFKYINHIFDNCPLLYAYADDTVVLSIGLNSNLKLMSKLNDWFGNNKLTINIKKIDFLHLVATVLVYLTLHILRQISLGKKALNIPTL